MFITKTKTKNTTIYYLSKSFRDSYTQKVSTKVVERIGTEEEIRKKIGKNKNLTKWLKDYASKKTKESKEDVSVSVSLNVSKNIKNSEQRIYNGGYLAIRNICYELGLHDICSKIANEDNFKGDLFQILVNVVSTNLLFENKSGETFTYAKTFLEKPRYTKREFFQAFSIFSKYDYHIQIDLYKNLNKLLKRNFSTCYYDVNSFFYDFTNKKEDQIENHDEDFLINYELSLDEFGFPLAYGIYNKNHQYREKAFEISNILSKDYNKAKVVVLSSYINTNTSSIASKVFTEGKVIKVVSPGSLKPELKKWILESEGWQELVSGKVVNLDNISFFDGEATPNSSKKVYSKFMRFYKKRSIDYYDENLGKKVKKTLAVVYAKEIEEQAFSKRKIKLENIVNTINKNVYEHYDDREYCLKYLSKYSKYIDPHESFLEKDRKLSLFTIKNDFINKTSNFDGYYVLVMDDNIDIKNAIKMQTEKWMYDYQFGLVSKDFSTMPKYISYKDRIHSHFILSSLALTVLKILLIKSNNKFTYYHLYEVLNNLKFLYMSGEGWIPIFNNDEAIDFIQKIIDKNIVNEFIPLELMNKIISKSPKI